MISIQSDNHDIQQQLDEFLNGIDALMLATINAQGHPEASYAPFIEHAGSYYIFVSGLASHTANLKHSALASVMFMDKMDDDHAYTRKRLTCQCKALVIERSNAVFESILQMMAEQFGNLISTLRGLNDFQLFQLTPVKGNFVAGFGKAFEIDFAKDGEIRHRRPN